LKIALIRALLLELNYLKEDLRSNKGDRSDKAFIHNAYALLTACRILYTAHQRPRVPKTKPMAGRWRGITARWSPHSDGYARM
jgi:hypothetical protein